MSRRGVLSDAGFYALRHVERYGTLVRGQRGLALQRNGYVSITPTRWVVTDAGRTAMAAWEAKKAK